MYCIQSPDKPVHYLRTDTLLDTSHIIDIKSCNNQNNFVRYLLM